MKPLGAALLALFASVSLLSAAQPPLVPAAQSDLDDFMAKVTAKRDENWKKLQQYILDERERIEVHGPAGIPLWGDTRDYTWFIRDGFFVRSPLRANGVAIADADRRKYEEEFLKRTRERDKRRVTPIKKDGTSTADVPAPAAEPERIPQESPESVDGLLAQTRQPQFIDQAYFLKFKFEQGKYALVGREKYNDQDVLRIEYYPTRLFSHEQDAEAQRARERRKDRNEDVESQTERMMNKSSLVTIWVEPASHQIVKYTFDNVNLDFLPAAWLVRMNDLKATMTMSQAFKDVWLPKNVEMYFSAMLAVGAIDMRYHLDYHDYRQATTSGRIKLTPGPR